jgi:hypothetical protein
MSSKQREALEEVVSILSTWADHLPPVIQEKAQEAIDKAEAALAEPLRNCDVGTIREQDLRFYDFCGSHSSCVECPLRGRVYSCSLSWSQMPYESEVRS